MTARLAAHVEVGGLLRRVESAGGTGVVVSRGDREAGSILVSLAERGVFKGLLERRPSLEGVSVWHLSTDMVSEPLEQLTKYLSRRRGRDPDLWIVELDIVGVERLAAEMVRTG